MKGFGGPSGGGRNERGLSSAVSSDPHLLSAPGPLSQDRGENKSRIWCLRRALCVKSYSQDFVKFINGFFFFFLSSWRRFPSTSHSFKPNRKNLAANAFLSLLLQLWFAGSDRRKSPQQPEKDNEESADRARSRSLTRPCPAATS